MHTHRLFHHRPLFVRGFVAEEMRDNTSIPIVLDESIWYHGSVQGASINAHVWMFVVR